MLQWASFAYDWARTDSRIVGLNPWHWTGAPGSGRFEPGLAEMPAVLDAVRAAPLTATTNHEVALLHLFSPSHCMCHSTWLQYRRIGKEIVSGRQAHVDFGL